MSLPQQLALPAMQTTWAQQLDPVLANLLVNGRLLTGISLVNGTTAVQHGLQRIPQGWFLVAPLGAATVYQSATQTNPMLTLSLVSSAAITTNIWVF